MNTRRPAPSRRSLAIPTLAVVLAAGIVVEGCLPEAQAQTPPAHADAGVRPDAAHHHQPRVVVRPRTIRPPPYTEPEPIADGGVFKVQPGKAPFTLVR